MSSTTNITKVEIRYVPAEKLGEMYAKAMLGLREGFLDPSTMELQDVPGFDHAKREANHPKNLETIYKHYQVIDGADDERPAQLKIRSMSYGDCIIIDGKPYYVASEGFVTIENDEVVPVTVEG